MSKIDRVRPIAEPIITERGFLLYDIEAHGPIVRITVEGTTTDVSPTIDDLSGISRELSRVLDDLDPIAASYTLEISTPGLERKLRTAQHFSRAVGELVTIKLRQALNGQRRVRGTIQSSNETTVYLEPQELGSPLEILLDDIDSARTIFEWGPSSTSDAPRGAQAAPNRRSTP